MIFIWHETGALFVGGWQQLGLSVFLWREIAAAPNGHAHTRDLRLPQFAADDCAACASGLPHRLFRLRPIAASNANFAHLQGQSTADAGGF